MAAINYVILKIFAVSCVICASSVLGSDDVHLVYEKVAGRIIEKRSAIYPGTKWCGAGSDAFNETDLGDKAETDACCRAHDNCEHNILSGEEKYSLKNEGFMTVSSCECDIEFSDCLQKSSELASKVIDRLYSSVLAAPCFYFESEDVAVWNATSRDTPKVSIYGKAIKYRNFLERVTDAVSDLVSIGTQIWGGIKRLYRFFFRSSDDE